MSIDGTAPTTRAVRAAATGLTARAKWAFTAFAAALLGLGLTPQAAQAASPAAPSSHHTNTARTGADQVVQRGTHATPKPGALPQTPREQHAPSGGAVLPGVAKPGFPDAGLTTAASETDRVPRLTRSKLPEVRGPPATFGR